MSDQGRKWAWRHPDDDTANGPHDSRADAIKDAFICEGGGRYMVGTCRQASVADFLAIIDAGELVERANELAYENDFSWYDDCIFGCEDEDAAAADLKKVICAWAERWLTVASVFTVDDEELVVVDAGGEVEHEH